jgi:hypothetical protein
MITKPPKTMSLQMHESDFVGLPLLTRQFVERINFYGLDRVRIHGLFVMLGLCSGAPDTKDRLDELFEKLDLVIPIDRSKNIDDLIGHLYGGYDNAISEFCYRSGAELKFREIKIPNLEKIFYIVDLIDHGLFDKDVVSMDKLADASRLYDAFIFNIGHQTADQNASLIDAFSCGIFQILLYAESDVFGSRQIAELIKSFLPPTYAQYFSTLQDNRIEYFLGLELGQVPLLSLMSSMELTYAKQMWGFQSSLFYRNQEPIDGVDDLDLWDWHGWVLENASKFDTDYPTELVPFSHSDITLTDIPKWQSSILDFDRCDSYIKKTWGYSAASIGTKMEILEYKALLVHLIYASLTSTRGLVH